MKPVLHGRDHRPGGADPLAIFGWLFDYDNEGGYGYVQANDSFDVDLKPDPLAIGGTAGMYLADASGDGLDIGSTGVVIIKSQAANISIQSAMSPLVIVVNGTAFSFQDDGNIVVT